MEQRLQKFMAENGIASRRKSEELIISGVVSVNGEIVTDMGIKIDTDRDVICVNGAAVKAAEGKLYYIINKPVGYVSTVKDQFGRPNVCELVKTDERLYPVGRLDYDSEGLLILTNDGDLTFRLTHPKHEIPKEYSAKLSGKAGDAETKKFESGIDIGGYITQPAKMEIKKIKNDSTIALITIKEGKNRQIRKMCDALGHKVISLKRVAIGELRLGDLKTGESRELSAEEVEYLKSL